jgi:hypothetical protein
MPKVIAPFVIKGTLEDLNFYVTQGENLVRIKGKTGVSSEEFARNPVFQKVRNHGKEFGRCSKKGQSFRCLARPYTDRAKDGSYAGRCASLMLDILYEDTTNLPGERTVEKGLESPDAKKYFIGFEGNKLRPLNKVLNAKWHWNESTSEFRINKFNPKKDINWPEKGQYVHLALIRANWNYTNNTFVTFNSEEIIFEKEDKPSNLSLKTEIPEGKELQLVFLFIAFSTIHRKQLKELKRANNTISIIDAI